VSNIEKARATQFSNLEIRSSKSLKEVAAIITSMSV